MWFYFKQSRYLESRSKHRFAYYDWPARIMLRPVEHHQRRLDRLQNCPIGSSPSNCGQALGRFYFGDCLQNVKDQTSFSFLSFILIYRYDRENRRRGTYFQKLYFRSHETCRAFFECWESMVATCCYFKFIYIYIFFSYFYDETYNSKLINEKIYIVVIEANKRNKLMIDD